jgi:hypothetical protein
VIPAGTWVLVGILTLAAGCSGPRPTAELPSRAPTSLASTPVASPSARPPDSPAPQRELPADFPVPDGLARVSPTGDPPDLVARWTSTRTGAAIYDEFVAILPEAGYAIRELLPGGAAAVIRIDAPAGGVWELAMFGADPLTVELRVAPD